MQYPYLPKLHRPMSALYLTWVFHHRENCIGFDKGLDRYPARLRWVRAVMRGCWESLRRFLDLMLGSVSLKYPDPIPDP